MSVVPNVQPRSYVEIAETYTKGREQAAQASAKKAQMWRTAANVSLIAIGVVLVIGAALAISGVAIVPGLALLYGAAFLSIMMTLSNSFAKDHQRDQISNEKWLPYLSKMPKTQEEFRQFLGAEGFNTQAIERQVSDLTRLAPLAAEYKYYQVEHQVATARKSWDKTHPRMDQMLKAAALAHAKLQNPSSTREIDTLPLPTNWERMTIPQISAQLA